MLALNEGFPEMIASTSAIPVLVHGLSSPSNHMKSMCGGIEKNADSILLRHTGVRLADHEGYIDER